MVHKLCLAPQLGTGTTLQPCLSFSTSGMGQVCAWCWWSHPLPAQEHGDGAGSCPSPMPVSWIFSAHLHPSRIGEPIGRPSPQDISSSPKLDPSPLASIPQALLWPQPGFLLGKLPANSRCNAKKPDHAKAKDRPWYPHRSPTLPLQSLAMRMLETSIIKYYQWCYETPSLGPTVMGGNSLSSLCLPAFPFHSTSCLCLRGSTVLNSIPSSPPPNPPGPAHPMDAAPQHLPAHRSVHWR